MGGLKDLDHHLLPSERALQLTNARLGRAELARRHDVLIRRDRRLAALRQQMLPALDLPARHAQLATQLGCGDLPMQHPLDLRTLELRGIPFVRPAHLPLLCHGPILRLLDSESVPHEKCLGELGSTYEATDVKRAGVARPTSDIEIERRSFRRASVRVHTCR